jgi:predicted lipoprotein with Yx(FWY)xxD motif
MVRTPRQGANGRPWRGMSRAGIGLALATVGIVAAACSSSTGSTSTTTTSSTVKAASSTSSTAASTSGSGSTAVVDTAVVPGLGTILVNSLGLTLYLFTTDKQSTSTCTGPCLAAWPALIASGHPTAGAGVNASLIGTVHNPSGTTQVTYNHWPLYTFVGDRAPGQARGQGNLTSGGYWWVLNPAGAAVHAMPSSTSGGGTGNGGGSGSGY